MAPSKRNDNPQKRPSARASGRVSMPADSMRGAGGRTSARTSARTGGTGQTSARTAVRAEVQGTGGAASRSAGSRGAASQQQARPLGAQRPSAATRALNSHDYQSWEVGDVADSAGLDILAAANAAAVETSAQFKEDQAFRAAAVAEARTASAEFAASGGGSSRLASNFDLPELSSAQDPSFLDMVGKEISLDDLEPDFSDFEELADVASENAGVAASRKVAGGVATGSASIGAAARSGGSQRTSQRTSQNLSQRSSQRTSQNLSRTSSQRNSQRMAAVGSSAASVSSQKPSVNASGRSSQKLSGKSPAEKRAEAQAAVRAGEKASVDGVAKAPDGASVPKKKAHRGIRKTLIAAGAVVGVAVICALLACWSIWWNGDDSADIQGKWLIGDTKKSMTISETGIKLSKDVTYIYELDQRHKTISYTFGTLEGGGQYRLSPDKEQLIIVEGEGLDFGTWLKGGFHYRMQRLKKSLFGTEASVWLDAAAPEGAQITLLTRKDSDTAAAMEAARQAKKEAAEAEKAAEKAKAEAEKAAKAEAEKAAAAKTDAAAAKTDAAKAGDAQTGTAKAESADAAKAESTSTKTDTAQTDTASSNG